MRRNQPLQTFPSVKFQILIPIFFLGGKLLAQQPAPVASPTPAGDAIAPSWETQKQARTYLLNIPAPRGLITDRNGSPLAQTRVSSNLAIDFPTPLKFTDREALSFAHRQIANAQALLRREISVSDDVILKHYRNRGILPLDIALDLKPLEIERFKSRPIPNLSLRAVYQRFYPNGRLAGHIIGYAGRSGRTPDKPLENNDLLWPGSEGREGLEQTFDAQLNGKPGQMNVTIDAAGKKISEKLAIPPQPGATVVTTIDEELQRQCELVLEKSAKRGAIVIIDPNNGDILAMASWPVFNPNIFVPSISTETFKALEDDPENPLIPRAYRSAYPPGSTFKVFIGIAALESGAISLHDEFGCPAAFDLGRITMHNWKKTDSGSLNFHEALEQSCDTWFYQVGIKTGAKPIIDWAFKFGFGVKTGIPLRSEAEGRIPTDEYMLKAQGRKILNGDIANMSIGQGDTLVTPLQMAQAMAIVANGGTFYKPRLVKQVQGIDNQIVTAYDVRAKAELAINPEHLAELKKAMVDVVSGGSGTGHKAGIEGVKVAGKTGTAQWGPKKKERNAAWFAGFAPADKPKYAFAALYEGEIGESTHGGDYAAPMIRKVLQPIFQQDKKDKKKAKAKATPTPKQDDAPTGAD
jgi:penicillin-binding protein 2